jgi:O-antigen/teichoic acid export membrane protein
MLLRHSAIYLLARGIPGLVGFLTVVVFTHLLSAAAYGQYALVVSAAVVVNAICYQWLNASMLRYLSQDGSQSGELLSAVLRGFLAISGAVVFVGVFAAAIWWEHVWGGLIVLAMVLTLTQGWLTLNLELIRGYLIPAHYGYVSMVKAVIALGLGTIFALLGFGAHGAIVGLIVGVVSAGIWASWGRWRSAIALRPERGQIKSLLRYGLPLTASFTLLVVISTTDRFMLAGLLDESAAGLYAASQGVAQQTVGVLMTMINLAAYPLILGTLEKYGVDEARAQLRKYAILLFGVGLPISAAFCLLPKEIAQVFLGGSYQDAAEEVMPWLAAATLFASIRTYYYDLPFYLGEKTRWQPLIITVAAVCNVVMNYWLIPIYGVIGSAYSTLMAHMLATLLSVSIGRSSFQLPNLSTDIAKLLAATAVMSLAISQMRGGAGFAGLMFPLLMGGLVYLASMFALDVPGVRINTIRVIMSTGRRT